MTKIENLKAQFLTEANIAEYAKQTDRLIWVEWLIDAPSINRNVEALEAAFWEATQR